MKTPYAILIGLALIAAAIFYREPSISAAQAGGIKTKYMDGFKCVASENGQTTCAILNDDQVTFAQVYFESAIFGKAHFHKKTVKWQ